MTYIRCFLSLYTNPSSDQLYKVFPQSVHQPKYCFGDKVYYQNDLV